MNAQDAKSLLVIVLGFSIVNYFLSGSECGLFAFAPALQEGMQSFFSNYWLLKIAFGVGILGLIFEKFGKAVVNGWMFFGEKMIGFVMQRVILSLIFFVFLFPIAMLWKLATKNPLKLKNEGDSMFFDRNHQYTKKDLENIW